MAPEPHRPTHPIERLNELYDQSHGIPWQNIKTSQLAATRDARISEWRRIWAKLGFQTESPVGCQGAG
jgi:hypothetical protein